MPEQLMTLEQVAKYLNVDKFTVYRLIASKQLPAFKVGNQWRFNSKMIEAWLARNSNLKRPPSSRNESSLS
jgi:excisionase family DNA binding protein